MQTPDFRARFEDRRPKLPADAAQAARDLGIVLQADDGGETLTGLHQGAIHLDAIAGHAQDQQCDRQQQDRPPAEGARQVPGRRIWCERRGSHAARGLPVLPSPCLPCW